MTIVRIVLFVIAAVMLSAALLVASVRVLELAELLAGGASNWFSARGVVGADPLRFISSLETGAVLAAICLGVVVPLRIIFKIPVRKVFTPFSSFRWRLLLIAFFTMSALQASALVVVIGLDETYGLIAGNFTGGLSFILLAILVYAISAPLEELVFRRWILFAQTRTMVRCALLSAASAAIFSFAHLSSDWILLAAHFISGFAYGWSVARLRGLEFSIGAHIAKNVSLACIVGLPGERQWGDEFSTAVFTSMVASIAVALVAELIHRRDQISARAGQRPLYSADGSTSPI